MATTYLLRKYVFHSDSVVNKCSAAYIGGVLTGTAIDAAIGGTVGAVADGKYGSWFGRGGPVNGGFFNRGLVRFGWYWTGAEDAIGLRIGAAGTFHLPFYYP